MNALDLVPGVSKLEIAGLALAGAAAVGFVGWQVHVQREIGRDQVRAEWNAEKLLLEQRALEEARSKARESLRRIEAQQENQRVQNQELAAARAAADRNARDADRVREQAATAARDWAARLADSPTRADVEAAGSAIRVCTDLLGRADRRAGLLASYADASRAAGLKCERDYDALTTEKP